MGYRLWRWIAWSVLFSAIPYLGVGLTTPFLFSAPQASTLDQLTGSGQLLLTGVALLGGGLCELSGMDASLRPKLRDSLIGVSACFALICALLYGAIAAKAADHEGLAEDQQHYVSFGSVVLFGMSVVVAGIAIVASHPKGGS